MRCIAVLLVLILVVVPVQAHESGESFETVVDGYTINIGYETQTPTTNDVVAFDFQLHRDGTPAPFSDVWIRIEDANKTVVFAGGLHNAQFGGTRMSYRFPEAGSYSLIVRYEQGDVAVAQATVPMTVASDAQDRGPISFVPMVAVALALIALGVIMWRVRRTVSPQKP